jgi:ABC-type multidrug transport system fused ATPase/permease subunit
MHTEELVMRLIKTEFEDWTVVMVTHRVKSVAEADSVFGHVAVMQQGLVVEQGSPAYLLNQSSTGIFRGMVDLQRRGH